MAKYLVLSRNASSVYIYVSSEMLLMMRLVFFWEERKNYLGKYFRRYFPRYLEPKSPSMDFERGTLRNLDKSLSLI